MNSNIPHKAKMRILGSVRCVLSRNVQDPCDAEAVREHAVEGCPSRRRERLRDCRANGELFPERGDFLIRVTADRDEECILALVPRHPGRHVVGHHSEAILGGDLAPHYLIRLGRVLDILGVLVGDDGDVATEHGLVELQRRTSITTEVEVVGNAYGHDSLLCRFRLSSVSASFRLVGTTGRYHHNFNFLKLFSLKPIERLANLSIEIYHVLAVLNVLPRRNTNKPLEV